MDYIFIISILLLICIDPVKRVSVMWIKWFKTKLLFSNTQFYIIDIKLMQVYLFAIILKIK